MSRCPVCGKEDPDSSRFCKECGFSFNGSQTGQLNPDTILEGRYIIVRTLGRGGMGAVYLALDQRLNNTPVAIKEMSTNAIGAGNLQAAIGAFKKEASLLIGLRHHALPIVRDFFARGEDRWYLVMDYIEGETLKQIAIRCGPIPEAEVLDWARQLGDILAFLHAQHPPIVFRDLKPSNIMLTPQGQIKLIDFGIARHFKQGISADTTAYGSSGFAPPEQYGENQTDPRSDIYALGATLHYLLTNLDPIKNPFNFEPPSKIVKVSPRMENAIMKTLELKTENRPKNIQELLNLMPRVGLRTTFKSGTDTVKPTISSKTDKNEKLQPSSEGAKKLPLQNIEKIKANTQITHGSLTKDENETAIIDISTNNEGQPTVDTQEVLPNSKETATLLLAQDGIGTMYNKKENNRIGVARLSMVGKPAKSRNIITVICLIVLILGGVYSFKHNRIQSASVDKVQNTPVTTEAAITSTVNNNQTSSNTGNNASGSRLAANKEIPIQNNMDVQAHPQYDLVPVQVGNNFGYRDRNSGAMVVEPQFNCANNFSEGLAFVWVNGFENGKGGYIDETGKMVIGPKFGWIGYEGASDFSEGLAAVRIGQKIGYIDKTGAIVIEPMFDTSCEFSDGLARAEMYGGPWGYIDKKANWIIPPTFREAGTFQNGIAEVSLFNDLRIGYIDKTGTIVKWK